MNKIYNYIVTSNAVSIQERQTKRGKVYDAVFRVTDAHTGRETQKRLSGFETKTKAKTAHAQFIKDECRFLDENPFKNRKEPEKQIPTVKELITEYLGSLSNINDESTIYDKQSTFNNHITPQLGDEKIKALTKERLYRWQDELWSKQKSDGRHYSYARLKKIRNFLNHFLEWVHDRYGYDNNLKDVKIPPNRRSEVSKTPKNYWTEEQFEQFISVVDDPLYKGLFSLLFYTGKRQGEIFALSPKDCLKDKLIINKSVTKKTFGDQPWAITTTKRHKDEVLPLSPAAQRVLKKYMQTDCYDPSSDFVFGKTRPLPAKTVSVRFDYYIDKAGVSRITIHGLRHSFVSMLIHHGANMTVVADLINDTLEQVTKTYAHMYDVDKLSVLQSIK